VRGLVAAHGGKVAAHSDGVGKGSEFSIELLHVSPTAAAEPVAPAPLADVTCRILVVDDNSDGAEMLALLLRHLGHVAFVASNVRDALRIAQEQRLTVALLDIGLPEMNGYELGERLRELEGLQKLRLAAVTGYGRPEDFEHSRTAGFDAHLVKPVTRDKLVEFLQQTARPAQGRGA
jgi:CheY-like chemotaxis protein